ncbi:MAG: sulfate ABC transporter permease subunit CysW [Lysobacterales bacterium]|nr:sulfate ABC transporter permease subunit CysW [Xanthomonadales bacterium]MCB1613632.1 sulfate ABC transporter permease subunit CysW [Xanthomonadales bacterium]MCP5475017.1 sulfate ABC transporter permease subunit CysW [Rhodanobacteraceae bacterium]
MAETTAAEAQSEAPWLRAALIGLALGVLLLLLGLPLLVVFAQAFSLGWSAYWQALADPEARAAIQLTLCLTVLTVPLSTVFGVAAAWALARFRFRGRGLLLTLIDLPFAISPVVVGLALIMLYGKFSPVGGWLIAHGVQVIFALPGMLLATLFICVPFVAKQVLHHLEAQAVDREEAAYTLGASPWSTFLRVTLPSIRASLLSGVLLCSARAMGEFGAVSVVSGHILGRTTTLPLQVENLYNEYNFQGAFAVASVLTLFGLLVLLIRSTQSWQQMRRQRSARGD